MQPKELLAAARKNSALPFSGSVFKDRHYEIVFINALVILERLGNNWGLTLDTYKEERLKDGNFSLREEVIAEKVIPYVADYPIAMAFSDHGRKMKMEGIIP